MSRAVLPLLLPVLVLTGCGRNDTQVDLEQIARSVVSPQEALPPAAASMARLDEDDVQRTLGLIRGEVSRQIRIERAHSRLSAQDPTMILAALSTLLAHGAQSDLGALVLVYRRDDFAPEFTLQIQGLAVQAAEQIMLRCGTPCPEGVRVLVQGLDSEFPSVQSITRTAFDSLCKLAGGSCKQPVRELALHWMEEQSEGCASPGARLAGAYASPAADDRITLHVDGTFSWGQAKGTWIGDSYELVLQIQREDGVEGLVLAVHEEELVLEHPPMHFTRVR